MTGVDLKHYPFIAGTSSAVIAASGTQSSAVTLYGLQLVALQMPSVWSTAALTFLASTDGTTYADMYDDVGAEYSVQADESQYIVLNPNDFMGIYYMRVRSGASGSAVTQTAARSITLVVRPV